MFNFFKKKPVETTKNEALFALATGQLIPIEQVNDVVFSQKMMGDGFAVIPTESKITSPVNGKIVSIFPSKHAISILTDTNIEVLVHMGLNTVELQGKGFDTQVEVGQTVTHETVLSIVDLDYIKEQGKDTAMIVVFTNMDVIDNFEISGQDVTVGQTIGSINVK